MVALIVAPGQYVRPRMLFVFGLRTKGLSAPKLGCSPVWVFEGGLFGSQSDVGSHEPRDGPPSALVHRCGNDWNRRILVVVHLRAKVGLPRRLRSLGPGGGNASKYPICVIRRPPHVRLRWREAGRSGVVRKSRLRIGEESGNGSYENAANPRQRHNDANLNKFSHRRFGRSDRQGNI